VTANRRTLQSRVDLFIHVKTREIVFILWAIFLNVREFFSHQINDPASVPESSLKYTSAFLSLGHIPSDILGVPLEQFRERSSYPANITRDLGGSKSNGDMFRLADFIASKNMDIPDNISTLTGSLLHKYPSVTAKQIMSSGTLKYDNLRVGQRGACLNQNLLGRCSNPKCMYIHASTKPMVQRAKEVAAKLGPAINGFMKSKESRTGAKRKRRPGPAASV
jgi:hypothetical protein